MAHFSSSSINQQWSIDLFSLHSSLALDGCIQDSIQATCTSHKERMQCVLRLRSTEIVFAIPTILRRRKVDVDLDWYIFCHPASSMKKAVEWIGILAQITPVTIINFALLIHRIRNREYECNASRERPACCMLDPPFSLWEMWIGVANVYRKVACQANTTRPSNRAPPACLFFPVTTQSGLSSHQLQEVSSATWICAWSRGIALPQDASGWVSIRHNRAI